VCVSVTLTLSVRASCRKVILCACRVCGHTVGQSAFAQLLPRSVGPHTLPVPVPVPVPVGRFTVAAPIQYVHKPPRDDKQGSVMSNHTRPHHSFTH
jgi:hypothetical protein